MNLLNTHNAPSFTKGPNGRVSLYLVWLFIFILMSVVHVDIRARESTAPVTSPVASKRSPSNIQVPELRAKKPEPEVAPHPLFQQLVEGSVDPVRTMVFLHTDTGFIPHQVVLEVSQRVELVVTNVSRKNRTASFLVDQFGVQEGMPFAEVKKVSLRPQKEGVFFLVSPESGFEAKLVVIVPPRLTQQ